MVSMIAMNDPDGVPPGGVLVADELLLPGSDPIACPAGVLVAAELRRKGLDVIRGRVPFHAAGAAGEEDPDAVALAVVFPARGGRAGLGVAVTGGDESARLASATALASYIQVMGAHRTILLASPRSFCAGVDRAIEVVEHALEGRDGPVYVRKQIVHNTHVVADLERRGAVFVDELDDVPEGATVVFSAHGVSPAVRGEAARRGLEVIDATCPLVTKVHAEARRFAGRGDTVILIGHAGHEEVEGTMGEAPDRTILVQTAGDVENLRVPDPERVTYLTQTTLAVDETAEVIAALRARFPALRGPGSEDICYATTNRQDAVHAIADESDLVLVIGSENSSNSQRLVELVRRHDTPSHLIDDVTDIRPEWLAATNVIGITAGASAPPRLVEEVISALAGLGPTTVIERETTRETVQFALPAILQRRGKKRMSAGTR
jgi:4-hydroxy-3-methylbut-2-enyl diphosphate reductase